MQSVKYVNVSAFDDNSHENEHSYTEKYSDILKEGWEPHSENIPRNSQQKTSGYPVCSALLSFITIYVSPFQDGKKIF